MAPFTAKLLLKCFEPAAKEEISPVEAYRSCWNMLKRNKTVSALGEGELALSLALDIKSYTVKEIDITCKVLKNLI